MYAQKTVAFQAVAESFVGVHDLSATNVGPVIEGFIESVKGYVGQDPWCCAFVQYCAKQVDKQFQAKNIRLSGSESDPFMSNWLYQTELCLALWNLTPASARVSPADVEPGMLIIWQEYSGDTPTSSGHVGIVTGIIDDQFISTVEGNTTGAAGVVRLGDGVYNKTRHRVYDTGPMRTVGYLRVWPTV